MAPRRSIARSVLMGVVGVANCVIYKGGGGTGTSMTDPYGDGWISMGNSSAAAAAPNDAGDTMLLQLANWSAGKDGTGEGSTDGGPFNVKTMVKHLFTAGNHLLVPMEVQTNRRMQRILRHVMAEVYEDMGLQRRKRICCMCRDVDGKYYQKLEGNSKATTGNQCENIKGLNGNKCELCTAKKDGEARSAEEIRKKYLLEGEEQAAKKKAEDDRKKEQQEAAKKKEEEDDRKKKQQALKEEEDRLNRLEKEKKDLEERKSNVLDKIKEGVKNGVDKHQEHLKYMREQINKKLQELEIEKVQIVEKEKDIVEEQKDIVEDENEALKKKVKVLEEQKANKNRCTPVLSNIKYDKGERDVDKDIEKEFYKVDQTNKLSHDREVARVFLLNWLSAIESSVTSVYNCHTNVGKQNAAKLLEYWRCRACGVSSKSSSCKTEFDKTFATCFPKPKK